ncbi:prominin-2 [Tiliqua scincoides]|uniref:prominin-2 n=1 Tax=Tiliqua scincoides TaxID=71010 RepID=UPI003462A2FD
MAGSRRPPGDLQVVEADNGPRLTANGQDTFVSKALIGPQIGKGGFILECGRLLVHWNFTDKSVLAFRNAGENAAFSHFTAALPGFRFEAAAGLACAFVLPGPVRPQQCSSGTPSILHFADVGADQRIPSHHRTPGSLKPLYGLVQSYLDVVQQNSFPRELLRDALKDPPTATTSQILHYQAGYIVCAAIAAVYFVAVPVIGLSICCCHRRRCCGGRIKAYRRSLLCQRNFFMLCLLLTTVVILGGIICAFAANQKVREEMEPGARDAMNTLQALRHHMDGIPQGVQLTMEEFTIPKQQILRDLTNVSWSIGSTIHFLLKETVYSVMTALKDRAQDLQNSLYHLQTVKETVQALTQYQDKLQSTLKDRKQSIITLLEDPHCTHCDSALSVAQNLDLGADYRKGPSVERVMKALHGLPKANFSEMIRRANSSFNSIPELAVLKMAEVIRDLKKEIEKTAKRVQSIADSFPILDRTRSMHSALLKAEDLSYPYFKEVKHYERYRWIAAVIACTVVLLIVMCNILGLSFGAYGLAVREDPSDYESRGEAGAKLLMAGVGLSFLFSWLLMLLVFGTFLVGGNVQTLVCKHWANQEIYTFIDTPGNLPPSMNLSQLLGLKKNLNITTAYQQCKNGAGLWEVLELEDSYSLNDHLSVAQYTAEFQKQLGSFNIRFEDVTLLNAEGKRDLDTFRDSGIDLIEYADFLAEIRNPVVKTDVKGLAENLETLIKVQSDRSLSDQLAGEAQKLREIQRTTVLAIEGLVAKLKESVQFLSTLAPGFQARINSTEARVGLVETVLPIQTQKILRQELDCFVQKEVGYISQYLNWLRRVLTEDIASCQPFSTAMDNGRVILCDRIADPWNAFWFSLGGCTFLLIPSIIFAMKIAKHFRPIRHRLISTGSEETYPFHIPRVTSLRL